LLAANVILISTAAIHLTAVMHSELFKCKRKAITHNENNFHIQASILSADCTRPKSSLIRRYLTAHIYSKNNRDNTSIPKMTDNKVLLRKRAELQNINLSPCYLSHRPVCCLQFYVLARSPS
jgi:hypothetical protein